MKKLLFITTSFLPNKLTGSEEFIRLLTKNLKEEFDVTIVTLRGLDTSYLYNPFSKKLPYKEIINGIKVFRLNNNHFKNFVIILFKMVFKNIDKFILEKIFSKKFIEYINLYLGPQFIGLEKFLKFNKFDTIHIGPMPYEFPNFVCYLHKKLKLKSKLITTPFFHDTQNIYYSNFFEEYLQTCDVIHLITQVEKENLKKAFNISEDKIEIIPLFLEIDDLEDEELLDAEVNNFKLKYNLENKTIVLGYNRGNLETKGIEYTLNALNEISKECQEICLIILGDPLDSRIHTKNGNLEILELGYVSVNQKKVIFKVCDIFSMPSQVESFGLMYLEAWLRKKPVLAFELKPLKEVLQKGAILCQIRSQKEVTNNLKKLIYDKNLRSKLGMEGYNWLHDNFVPHLVMKRYKNILN